jgi:hypothetical protein
MPSGSRVNVLRSRPWVIVRRSALVLILLVLAYRNYGSVLTEWFRTPGPSELIRVTHTEFRRDAADEPPAWFVGLENRSTNTTYENIVLEATYSDGDVVLERDQLVVDERLLPGQEVLIGSRDSEFHEGATEGWVRVIGADAVE